MGEKRFVVVVVVVGIVAAVVAFVVASCCSLLWVYTTHKLPWKGVPANYICLLCLLFLLL